MLYLVATPIGNLEDITLRALRILREASVVAAEDTRQTRKLMSHYEIKTPLIAYHEHSGPAATASLVRRMAEDGQSVALVTDAGTPGISDPGHDLVRAAIEADIPVVPIPGPSAFISGLIASGLPSARFVFEGFLPRTKSSRLAKLNQLASEPRTLVFYESPQRVGETLAEMTSALGGGRAACVARELTKMFEEFRRGTLEHLAAHYAKDAPRGECTLIIAGSEGVALAPLEAETAGGSRNDLIKQLASELGVPRRELYQVVAQLKQRSQGEET